MTEISSKHRGLGRGLNALFEDEEDVGPVPDYRAPDDSVGAGDGRLMVPVERLRPGASQPRQLFDDEAIGELAGSIKQHGLLQPLLVRSLPDAAGEYEIIAGERRWRAAQRAQLHEVPVVVLSLSDAEALEVALVENLQREDLSPVEEAYGYKRLMDEYAHTQEKLAELLGKSRPHIANMVRLLSLPDAILKHLEDGDLSIGHARALLACDDPLPVAQIVIKDKLNVRQTEALVSEHVGRSSSNSSAKASGKKQKDADTVALERDLSMVLGMKVSIHHKNMKKGAGALQVQYKSLDQLDDILSRLSHAPNARLVD